MKTGKGYCNVRILAALLAALVLSAALPAVLSSCAPGVPGAETSDQPGTDITVTPGETAALLTDIADYSVVWGESSDDWEIAAAVTLKNVIKSLGGAGELYSDTAGGDNSAENFHEIVVGKTNRPESADAYAELRADEGLVKAFPDGRIVVAGGSRESMERAADGFAQILKDQGLKISSDTMISYLGSSYRITSLSLNGISLGEYSLAAGNSSDLDLKAALYIFSKAVTEATGIVLRTEAADATGPVIRFEKGSGGASVASSGKSGITVSAQGGAVVRAASAFSELIVPRDASGDVSLSVASGPLDAGTAVTYPESDIGGLYGKAPVALADQKNACAAIYDIYPALSGGEPELKYTFTPTSALGYSTGSTYAHRIDEFRIRYSETLQSFVAGFTSSSGYVGLAEIPSGKCLWQTSLAGYGPHSIEYLPDGNTAVALSGNGDETKSCIRVYATSSGRKTENRYAEADLDGAHAVLWDDVRGILWALGTQAVKAYAVEGGERPSLTEIPSYGRTVSIGGHDMSALPGYDDFLLLSGKGSYVFSKTSGTAVKAGTNLASSSTKCACGIPDPDGGLLIFKTVATKVYASHDTDRFTVLRLGLAGSSPDRVDLTGGKLFTLVFADRAFYKARAVYPAY